MTGNEQETGTLYVIATPIGNLEDITQRALKILSGVSLILCEDTRETRKLLSKFGIRNKLISFHSYSEANKSEYAIRQLKEGRDLALVSESGTPCVSDPGYVLIKTAVRGGIKILPVPGPSAMTAALSVSGMPTEKVLFRGFLPRIRGKRVKELLFIKNLNITTVIYESPRRIIKTLEDLASFMPDREIFLVREMTKIYEQSFRGTASEILNNIGEGKLKGEFTLVLSAGARQKPENDKSIRKKAVRMMDKFKLSARDTAKMLSAEYGVPKKNVYRMVTSLKNGEGFGDEE